MKSFVVLTYYQLMHAVACALTLKEKANLYFSQNYLDISEDFLERIRETGLFYKVVCLSQKEYVVPFTEELKKTKGMSEEEIDAIGNSIFEKYLEPHYAELFKDADFDDEIYVYNDFQRHYYYIAKHFKNIIGVEDGYKSLAQQIKVHRFKGNHKLVEPFLGKYYPEPLYKYKNVKKIVSSCDFENLPEYYREKLEVLDFKDLLEKNKASFVKIMLYIFKLENLQIQNDSILVLGTPLARARYCNASQAYLLYKKLVNELLAEHPGACIYIKPHPADTLDYELLGAENVIVLDKAFPIELLEYKGGHFQKTVSFGSTAIMDKLSQDNMILYSGTGSIPDVKRFIKEYVKDERLIFNVYVKLEEIDIDTYINIYGYLRQYVNFYINVKVIVNQTMLDEARTYLDLRKLQAEIDGYKKRRERSEEAAFYNREVTELSNLQKGFSDYASIELVSLSSMDTEAIYDNIISRDRFDYCLLINAKNLGLYVMKKSVQAIRDKCALGYLFLNYTFLSERSKQKVFLGSGRVGDHYTKALDNRIVHASFFSELMENHGNMERVNEIFNFHSMRLAKRVILFLHLDMKPYTEIINGEEYFAGKVMEVAGSQQEPEFIAGEIALLLSEYYNWMKIIAPKRVDGAVASFLSGVPISEKLKLEALEQYVESLLLERKIEQSRAIYNKLPIYDYSAKAISRLTVNGKVNQMNWEFFRVGSKRKKQKERKKKRKAFYKKVLRFIRRNLKKIKNGGKNV